MKNILLLSIFFLVYNLCSAQEDSLKNFWSPTAAVGINLSQISLTNWTQGGDNTITWVLIGNGGMDYFGEQWTVRNRIKLAYGRTKLGSQDFRTNDNEIYIESVLSKNIGWAVDPYVSNTIKTAITTGYNYKKEPPEIIADFFDPGYITQSLGFTYDKYALLKTRLGFALQEVFTNKYRNYTDNETTENIEAFKLETGFESVTYFQATIYDNLTAKSMIRLFTRFENLDVWDVRWDNVLIAKVNDFLNVNLTFLFIYEKNQSVYTQMKQTLQLSFIYQIF